MTYTESLNIDFVDMLGSGYVMDHCMSAFKYRQEEKLYRVYVTDALKAIADNTRRYAGGYNLTSRFFDWVYKDKPKGNKREETADEIILRIKQKIEG